MSTASEIAKWLIVSVYLLNIIRAPMLVGRTVTLTHKNITAHVVWSLLGMALVVVFW